MYERDLLNVLCLQETPSWLFRSSNGISCCPWRSRESPQTHARNLSSPSTLSSPSSCPPPSLKFNGNEPHWLPATLWPVSSLHQYLQKCICSYWLKTRDFNLTEVFFFGLNENKFYLLYFLQCLFHWIEAASTCLSGFLTWFLAITSVITYICLHKAVVGYFLCSNKSTVLYCR